MNAKNQQTMETNEKMNPNRVQLIGHLGKDPELRKFDNGKQLARFSIATNERFTFGDGQAKEDTQWHNIVVWGRQAAEAAEQLSKGTRVAIIGRLTHGSYEGKDGQKRYYTEVVMNSFQVMEAKVAEAEAA